MGRFCFTQLPLVGCYLDKETITSESGSVQILMVLQDTKPCRMAWRSSLTQAHSLLSWLA